MVSALIVAWYRAKYYIFRCGDIHVASYPGLPSQLLWKIALATKKASIWPGKKARLWLTQRIHEGKEYIKLITKAWSNLKQEDPTATTVQHVVRKTWHT